MGETSFKIMLLVFNLIFIAFISAIIIFIREYRTKKKAHKQELKTKEALHKKALIETQVEIQHETMKHIGREIHDNIGQKLTLSSIYLQQSIFENKELKKLESLNGVNDLINESLIELRRLSKSLTDNTIEHFSMDELIEKECAKVRNLNIFSIAFNNHLKNDISNHHIKGFVFRIVQEFLQNSIKHSECKSVTISISNSPDELLLDFKDDGKGFDAEKTDFEGIGLKNMKERIILLSGEYNLSSDKNGTHLTLKIPL